MSDDIQSSQLALAHRQSGMMLMFTLLLIAFLVYATLSTILGTLGLFFLLLPIPFCVIVVRGYFRRESWALPWVMTIWMLAIGLCFLLMVFEFIAASTGVTDTWGYLQGLLLLFLCWSMLQRLKLLRHPMFQAWYGGTAPVLDQNIALQSNEVLASCPNCHSLLAVQPLTMSTDERCPKCQSRLVSEESIALYGEEE
ncbi:MAG: hypothetical protein VX473_02030 [Candidatus Thermoplasmatota archaeon]|nr:hypothetical protein [Candidatus Thermoplasmatota archaeon]